MTNDHDQAKDFRPWYILWPYAAQAEVTEAGGQLMRDIFGQKGSVFGCCFPRMRLGGYFQTKTQREPGAGLSQNIGSPSLLGVWGGVLTLRPTWLSREGPEPILPIYCSLKQTCMRERHSMTNHGSFWFQEEVKVLIDLLTELWDQHVLSFWSLQTSAWQLNSQNVFVHFGQQSTQRHWYTEARALPGTRHTAGRIGARATLRELPWISWGKGSRFRELPVLFFFFFFFFFFFSDLHFCHFVS